MGLTKEQKEYCEHMPKIYRGKYRKALKGHSLRAALDSLCLDCTNWQRVEVKNCPITTCPLHKYRPYRERSASQERTLGAEKDAGLIT